MHIGCGILIVIAIVVAVVLYRRGDSENGCPPPQGEAVALYRGNAARSGEEQGPGPNGVPVRQWTSDLGVRHHSPPTVAEGLVYVAAGGDATTADTIITFEVLQGTETHRLKDGEYGYVAPAIAKGLIYVVDDNLRAIDATTHEECWDADIDDGTGSSPAIADGIVYVSDSNGVKAFDALTGEPRWNEVVLRSTGGQTTAPAVLDGKIYVGAGNLLHAIDTENGRILWSYEAIAPLTGPPAVSDGVVYFSNGVYLYAINANTGSEHWPEIGLSSGSFGSGGGETVAVSNGMVYSVADGRELLAVESETGRVAWRFRTTPVVDVSTGQLNDSLEEDSVVVANGVVYVTGSPNISEIPGYVFAIDANSGSERWRFQTGGQCLSAPTIVGGTLYVSCRDGFLYAIGGTLAPGVATPAAT